METAAFIERWHKLVETRDLRGVGELLADDVAFRSPAFHKPYHGRGPVSFILTGIIQLLPDLHYLSAFSNEQRGVVLHFRGTMTTEERELDVEGVDILKLDEHGRIVDFRVMIRPLNSLQAVADAMKKRFEARATR